MRSYITILFLFIGFWIQAQEVIMSTSEISSLQEKVKELSNQTATISSSFIQLKHMEFLTNDIKTSGNMYFKSPNWVKWEYTEPYSYSIIFKENELLINDGGTKSNIKMGSSKLFKMLNELIVNSVTGDMFEDDSFNISYFKTENFNNVVFQTKDEKLAKMISVFELFFNAESGEVVEVKMIEPSLDYTRIIFSNRVNNGNLEDEIFSN